MKNNEKGLTLVELLVVIVIAFFIMGIIYSVAKFTIDYHSVETTKTKMQQEVNYIVTEIQRVHRNGDPYTLSITENEVAIGKNRDESNLRVISDQYKYGVTSDNFESDTGSSVTYVDPNSKDLSLNSFIVRSPENENIKVEITTIISRFKNRE